MIRDTIDFQKTGTTAKKQNTVVRSFTEEEYQTLTNMATEVVIRDWIATVPHYIWTNITLLWCDKHWSYIPYCKSCMAIFHMRMKHIEIDYHFLREMVHHNHLIKPLLRQLRNKLPLHSIKSSVWGGDVGINIYGFYYISLIIIFNI